MTRDAEEKGLRSAALQNASSILQARQRAEAELLRTKDELEQKTSELREETRALELLNRAGVVLGANLDLKALLQSVTDAATELSGARYGAFFYNTTDDSGDSYLPYTLSGAPREAFEHLGQPRATPVFGPTFRGGPPVRSDDITTDPRYGKWAPHHGLPKGHLPVRSYLAVPVISRSGEVIGGLFFAHPEPAVFTDRSERLIVGIAAQAGVAIDNARLYEGALQSAERERTARAEAERASAMKDEFLAMLSHELRTPLGAILGWAQVLRMGNIQERELDRALETIERNARLQTQLIDDLLDMSRITSGNLRLEIRSVDPVSILEQAIETVAPVAATKGVRIEKALPPGARRLAADPARLQQILWNLLSNAIKFTPRDGFVRVALEEAGRHLEIRVTDTGSGIKPEFLPHVFDRFRQADASLTRTVGGIGLGLTIVKHLVELHGGSVQAESEGEGRGACFTIHLPLDLERPSDPAWPPTRDSNDAIPFEHVDLAGVTVLVVDDERDSREVMRRILATCGAHVILASSGEEALAALDLHEPHVIVSDIGMPGMNGYEMLRRLRSRPTSPTIPIPAVALTAFARSEDRTRALRAGFQMHVSKPVDASELVATVAALARRT